jgi:hypothetical protein
MLLKVDTNIFLSKSKRHTPHYVSQNLYNDFVDFTKLPEGISKEAKALLYRPPKIKALAKAYRDIALQMKSNALRKLEKAEN